VGLNDLEFGTLGSVVYGGIILGSAVATAIFQRSSWIKPLLSLTLTLNCLSLWLFTLIEEFYIMAAIRFFIGFCQVFICIYMPVWADTFANSEKQKAAWLTFLILASPLGIVLGFSLTSIMV
jgi:predicted MFS family arabinose efflux permease